MRTRVASALVLLPAVVIALGLGNPVWGIAAAAVAVLAVRELLDLAAAGGYRPERWLAYTAAAALTLAGLWSDVHGVPLVIALLVIASYVMQLGRKAEARSLADWAAAIAFPTALGVLISYAVLLRGRPDGLAWTALLLAMVWANDSAAYVGGRAFGRRPFFHSISPKKTVEGAAAGTVAAVAIGLLAPAVGVLGPEPLRALGTVSPLALAAVGLAVSVAAPAGDLSQSFMKRQVGAKDSSHLIPGHGGVLDRIDSLLFAAPVGYFAALLLGG